MGGNRKITSYFEGIPQFWTNPSYPILECLDSKFRGSNPNSSWFKWFKVHSPPPGVLSTWISAATPWGRGAPSSWSTNASRTPPTASLADFLAVHHFFWFKSCKKLGKTWGKWCSEPVKKIMIKEEKHMQLGDLARFG